MADRIWWVFHVGRDQSLYFGTPEEADRRITRLSERYNAPRSWGPASKREAEHAVAILKLQQENGTTLQPWEQRAVTDAKLRERRGAERLA